MLLIVALDVDQTRIHFYGLAAISLVMLQVPSDHWKLKWEKCRSINREVLIRLVGQECPLHRLPKIRIQVLRLDGNEARLQVAQAPRKWRIILCAYVN